VLQVQKGWTCAFALGFFPCVFLALMIHLLRLQIARDCPEGREVVEEDNSWAEIQDDPWGGGTLPADGNQAMQ
jgi:hypothetical protein